MEPKIPLLLGKIGNITAAERNTSSSTQYSGQYTPVPHMGTDVVPRAPSQRKTEENPRGRWGI